MKTQYADGMNNVVSTLRKRRWRDVMVAALFTIGVAVNFAAVNAAVNAATTEQPAPSYATQPAPSADPDAGLLVAHRDAADQRVAASK